jgi:transcriptional regulator with XRE-family HTH domain
MTQDQERQEFCRRLDRSIARSELDDIEIADQLGISKQAFSQIRNGHRPGALHRDKIAEILKIDPQWLSFGDPDKAPDWWNFLIVDKTTQAHIDQVTSRVKEDPKALEHNPARGMRVVGTVSAGDGDISQFVKQEEPPIAFPDDWQVVRVEGMSAYPVIYPGQLAIVDTARATSPRVWTDQHRIDLHDNLVLIQTDGDQPRAYLKRFCRELAAPHGFVLASVDGGRSSPWISPEKILIIAPIVGVMFLDPRQPRKKSWHQKTVVVTVE